MTNPIEKTPDADQSPAYEIRLLGHLDARWAERLGVPHLAHESDGTTVMRLAAADQSALHGVLQRIRDLGLPLIWVVRIYPANRSGPAV